MITIITATIPNTLLRPKITSHKKGKSLFACNCVHQNRFMRQWHLKNWKAETIADALLEFFSYTSITKISRCDNTQVFRSEITTKLRNRLVSYHHQSYGTVERAERTISEILKNSFLNCAGCVHKPSHHDCSCAGGGPRISRWSVNEVFMKLGYPRSLLSDLGTEFQNQIMDGVCRVMGVHKLKTTVHRPSANGRCERSHHTISTCLAKLVNTNQTDWWHSPWTVRRMKRPTIRHFSLCMVGSRICL